MDVLFVIEIDYVPTEYIFSFAMHPQQDRDYAINIPAGARASNLF